MLLHSEPDFDVALREIEENGVFIPFIHLDVYYFSATVMRRLLVVWQEIQPKLPPIVFAQGTVDDHKHRRLVSKFGFIPWGSTPCTDGINRTLHVYFKPKDLNHGVGLQ